MTRVRSGRRGAPVLSPPPQLPARPGAGGPGRVRRVLRRLRRAHPGLLDPPGAGRRHGVRPALGDVRHGARAARRSSAARPPRRNRAGCSRSPARSSRTTGATAASSAPRWRGSACPCRALSDPEIERIEELAGIAGLAAQLADAMRTLPEEQRRAVELRVVERVRLRRRRGAARRERADGAGTRLARAASALAHSAGGRRVTRDGATARGPARGGARATSRPTRARRRRRRARSPRCWRSPLVGGGAAADATTCSTAARRRRTSAAQIPRYAPGQGEQRQIAAKLRVAGVPLPFGVARLRDGRGPRCALAGVVNGSALGDLAGGRFRPFAADRVGTCNVPGRATIDQTTVAGHVVLYGLAPAGARSVVLPELGRSFTLGPDRAFLFVCPKRAPVQGGLPGIDRRESTSCAERCPTRSCSAEASAA